MTSGQYVVWTNSSHPCITHPVNTEHAVDEWTLREGRKRHNLLDTGRGGTWWAPGAIGWWVGALFATGATLFALGSAPFYSEAVGYRPDAWTFFIGSLFFTSAAFLQYLEAVNAPVPGRKSIRKRLLAWEPKNPGWWSTLIQFAGTLCFNVSTFSALLRHLSTPQVERLVWRPDIAGSICFLVASILAWRELTHRFWTWQIRSISWWIVVLNLIGSVAFGASAVAAYVVPTTGEPWNILVVNLGTFIGALCFFAGAALLLPERTAKAAYPRPAPAREIR
ncbi:MAG: hypothetical protein KKF41_15405 [Actinobacteria bacterium]|nr:hypothetical protein [Actinomycetota bacterium]MBU1943288.1 hypothetical protein [Actinomycetota bacterium]MBU2688963.1 hypothetical protein [Actinomycetota bacterium]